MVACMKALLCGLFSLSAMAGLQAATAYEALRVVGKQKGDASLDRVIEVRATRGVPAPGVWKVVVADQDARGGIREFDVKGTALTGDRTPPTAPNGQALNMNQLNLDSDGAYTVAEREAKKSGFAYDYVNYTLRSGGREAAPVWEIRLVDEQNGNTALLSMGADNGKLLASEGLNKASAPPRIAENPRAAREEEGEEMEPEPGEDVVIQERRVEERRREREVEVDKPGNKMTRFFDRAGRHIGGAFQKFGDKLDRTFGSPPPRRVERRSTPPPPSKRDRNGTEYYRPRD
jgi:hypothetical protein